ncbi:MAG: PAS domain S-box protein [Sulfuricaulis sp.]|nr:PAS domain S-box protein [Sulfuricaulis sp.]
MAKPRDSENKVQRKSSAAVHGRRARAVTLRKPDDEAPLSNRALDYEGRIADLRAKIHELEESRSTLATLLRDLETKEGRIEHIHQSWVAVFDAIVDPIFMHDRQGHIVRANRAYAELAGMDIKDVIGRLYWQVFPRREGPLANCSLTLSEKQDRAEEDLALETGKIYRCRFFTLRDRAGGYFASLHIMQDITERKSMETALQQERDFISAVMHTLGALVVVLDREGRIIQFNHACETVTGFSFAEIEGKPLWDALLLPEELDSVRAVFNDLRRGMFPNEHDNYWRTKDGGRRLIHWSNTTLTDESGAVQYLLATGIDITDRRAAENALRDSEARFRALIENSSDITTLLDRDGIAHYTSPSIGRVLGYGDNELVGQNVLALVHPDDLPRVQHALARVLENPGLAQHVEHRFRDKDGVWRYLESVGKYSLDDSPVSGIVVNSRDITARKRAEEKMRESDESLRKLNRALRTLSGCNESLVHAMDEQELLAAICKVIVRTGGYRFAWVGYAEHDDGKSVRPMNFAGEEAGFLDAFRFSWGDNESGRNPIGEAIRTGSPQGIRNIEASSAMLLPCEEAQRRGYMSCIALPLRNGDTVMGVLAIYAAESDAFNDEEVKLLMELADDLVYGIGALRTRVEREHAMEQNRLNTVRMEKALLETIEAIGSALEKRDPYTAGHQRQVAKLAHAIAQEMKLPQEVAEGIYMGCLIHDIGKIYIPAEILSRPGKLTAPEFEIIKCHPQVGYDIIKGIEFPWPVAKMILEHHERLNGSGYPQGLKGGEISLEARILAVADVVEAMASHRPYRPGLGVDKALEEISQNRETLYDPQAVDVCLRLFREKGFQFDV